jgi:hypothetical protein
LRGCYRSNKRSAAQSARLAVEFAQISRFSALGGLEVDAEECEIARQELTSTSPFDSDKFIPTRDQVLTVFIGYLIFGRQ